MLLYLCLQNTPQIDHVDLHDCSSTMLVNLADLLSLLFGKSRPWQASMIELGNPLPDSGVNVTTSEKVKGYMQSWLNAASPEQLGSLSMFVGSRPGKLSLRHTLCDSLRH